MGRNRGRREWGGSGEGVGRDEEKKLESLAASLPPFPTIVLFEAISSSALPSKDCMSVTG